VKRYEGEGEKRLLDTPDESKYVFAQVLDDCGQVRGEMVAAAGVRYSCARAATALHHRSHGLNGKPNGALDIALV
jgi:hypothetical protein